MTLLRFKNTLQIIQNLRLALRIAEDRQLDEVAERLREALDEAETAQKTVRETTVITGAARKKGL